MAAPATASPAPVKQGGLIRWAAVIPALLFALLVFVLIILFLDPFARWALIKGGQAVFGAKVEVKSVDVTLRKSSIRIESMQVADKSSPMMNLFEFADATLDARSLPLLEKKVIIDQANIKGMKFGTPRKTSGALLLEEKKPGFVGQAMDRVWGQVESIGVDKLESAKTFYDPKTVVNPDSLATFKAAEAVKDNLESAPADVQKQITSLDAENRAKALQQRVESVGKGSNDAASILQKATEVKKIQDDLQQLKSDIQSTRQGVQDRIQSAQNQMEEVKKAKEEDWNKIRSTLSLPTLDKASIARSIFGPAVAQNLEKLLGWVHMARQYMPSKPQKPIPPPRGRGRTIEFPKQNVLPRFLLVKANVTGEVGLETPFGFEGLIQGITTNPPLYGKPATLDFHGSQGPRAFTAKISIDHTTPNDVESFQGSFTGFPIRQVELGQKESLGLNVAHAIGSVQGGVSIRNDGIEGTAAFQASDLTVQPKIETGSSSDIAKRLTGSLTTSLSQVKNISAGVRVAGSVRSPTISVESNLGDIVASSLKNAVGSEVEHQEKALRAELDRVTSAKIQELQGQIDGLKSSSLPQLASASQVVDELLKQATGSLGTSGGAKKPIDSLKGIFGR